MQPTLTPDPSPRDFSAAAREKSRGEGEPASNSPSLFHPRRKTLAGLAFGEDQVDDLLRRRLDGQRLGLGFPSAT